MADIYHVVPEQILNARRVDHHADIDALGVMLYEMVTGELPFKGGVGQVVFAHIQQPPPDPCGIRADISATFAHAIMQAMAKNPMNALLRRVNGQL